MRERNAQPIYEWLVTHIDTLRTVLSAPHSWFANLGELRYGVVNKLGDAECHVYIDRGASVLGVAHLDSVQPYKHFWMNKEFLAAPTIDNRLGAWLMLCGLPDLGIEIDVLLTDNEEMGMSTAVDFVADKEYNWMFSFDRAGNDVVCYQYEDKALSTLLESFDMTVGFGSYSDIVDLDHLGIQGMNWGCGMHNYHALGAYCELGDLAETLTGFCSFYDAYRHISMPWTPIYSRYGRRHDYSSSLYSGIEVYDETGQEYYPLARSSSLSSMTDAEWEEWADKNWDSILDRKPTKRDRSGEIKWDMLDSYQAKIALNNVEHFLGGYDAPDEWHVNYSWGDINQPDISESISSLYKDGSIVLCENCENLFVRGDVNKYPSLGRTLCKACFFYEAAFHYHDEETK